MDNTKSGTIDDSCMESGDWRAQLHEDSRQKIVNKLMETLKRHIPYSENEGPEELKKRALSDEEKIYTAVTSQSDYLRKISLKMLAVDIGTENPMADSMQSNSAANGVNPSGSEYKVMQQLENQGRPLPVDIASNHTSWGQQQFMPQRMHCDIAAFDSTAQTGNPNGGDWQEEVYQKIQVMKDLYLLDLNDMHQKVAGKLRHQYSLPHQLKNVQLEKLTVLNNKLVRFMRILQVPKRGILPHHKDKLGIYEKQISNVIKSNRRKLAAPQQQSQNLPLPHMHSPWQSQQSHSELTQMQSHESQMSLQGYMAAMQRMASRQQNIFSSLAGSSKSQQDIINYIQPSSNLDPGQNSSMNSVQGSVSAMQPNNMGSLHQNTVPSLPGSLKSQQNMMHSMQPDSNLGPGESSSNNSLPQVSVGSLLQQKAGGSVASVDFMESGDWRAQLHADARQRIVNKIMDTLIRLSFSGHEIEKIATKFEEKIFTVATSQSEYLRKISLKMLTLGTRSQSSMPVAMQPNIATNMGNPSDLGSKVMQKVNNQEQSLSIPVPPVQTQPGQQVISQSMHNNIGSTGVQSHENQMNLHGGGDASVDFTESSDWRAQLLADSRKTTVNKIRDTLMRHLTLYGDEGLKELTSVAKRFEENAYIAATSESDYLSKVSLMLNLDNRPQNPMINAYMHSNSTANAKNTN